MAAPDPQRILVIRRDNIGDLVCTTPLLAALRLRYPDSWIGVLANSYNAPVLDGNRDVDAVFAYRKLKHLGNEGSALAALGGRIATLWALRRRNLDLAIIAAGAQDLRGERLARWLSPGRIVRSASIEAGQHEVERTFSAVRFLGYEGPVPPLHIVPGGSSMGRIREMVDAAGLEPPLVAVHISARRVAQRWPAERFAQLIVALHDKFGAATLLLWSPGTENHPQHPGDDGKAQAVMDLIGNRASVLPLPTSALGDLIAGLAQCDAVICSDGGAMHLAAALGKPIACFFGDSPVDRWRPWGVRHQVLRATTGSVADVPAEAAVEAVALLLGR
jgi:ADP-heptose:LPS heptosyltransferase